ncbi:nucleoside diphosphate kinase 7 isoform X2 [Phlebotomus argentipes]|uniref:nucleoside diphosphate kinase 7 isoform X2 n=1 Tax=Phlebotomus argentipes TaxID=94469 RepID=UPI002892D1FE|nr:nucleoside diphosphate kinase 7 isoform X2 [Phlebotomus argentipes]
MNSYDPEKLIFIALCEADGGLERRIFLHFYSHDNSVEMIDEKTRKPFLRRTRVDQLSNRDFYVGSRLFIFGRNINIIDYGDSKTRKELSPRMERTFLLLKSKSLHKLGEIWCALLKQDFQVVNCRMIKLKPEDTVKIYGEETDSTRLSQLFSSTIEGVSVALEIVSKSAVDRMRRFCEENFPDLPIYSSVSSSNASRDIEYFFRTQNFSPTANFSGSTLAVVKPHAVRSGKTGEIIKEILGNDLRITALKMVHMGRKNCEDFLQVYRGVAPEYNQMILELASGPCVAMEISSDDAHGVFRRLCGPFDPEVAQKLRPQTLRARFGNDRALNAVHCTDLPEDCASEVAFFFNN